MEQIHNVDENLLDVVNESGKSETVKSLLIRTPILDVEDGEFVFDDKLDVKLHNKVMLPMMMVASSLVSFTLIGRQFIEALLRLTYIQLKKLKGLTILARINDDVAPIVIPAAKLVTILPAWYALYAVIRPGGFIALFGSVYAFDTILELEIVLNMNAQVWIASWNLKE